MNNLPPPILIPVLIFAAGFALALRAGPVADSLRKLGKPDPARAAQGLRAEDVLKGDPKVRLVRLAGALVCLVGLVAMWTGVHTAMGR